MKKILLIATGGTIAAKDTGSGLTPGMYPEELLRCIPEIKKFCEADAVQILNIDSSNIQPEDWLLISRAICENYERYDGFVITHGTDTMAYTASALSYLIQNLSKPVVLTGSQVPMGQGSSDARKNLGDAFWFSAQPQCAGVYLVFDGKAILGTRASKVKTKSYDAFESINFPVAAYINNRHEPLQIRQKALPSGEVRFYSRIDPGVFLLKLIPGMEPEILDYVGDRYDAIVIESYGMGGLPFVDKRNFLERVEHLAARGKILVVATQVKSEGSDLSVYEVGMKAAMSVPLLQSMDMTVETVVTKLMWILAGTKNFDEVKALFYTPVNDDISLFPTDFTAGS